MVLTSFIGSEEASEFRRLVMDSVGSVADYFSEIMHKQDTGLLVELRHFPGKSRKHASLNLNGVHGLREVEAEFHSYFNGQLHGNRIWTGVVCGIGMTFVEPLYYSSFFSRENIYGYSNDFERFTYFSHTSLDCIVEAGKQPDVLHIHNLGTSIVGPLFWDVFVNQGLGGTRIILTCQSFESQERTSFIDYVTLRMVLKCTKPLDNL